MTTTPLKRAVAFVSFGRVFRLINTLRLPYSADRHNLQASAGAFAAKETQIYNAVFSKL